MRLAHIAWIWKSSVYDSSFISACSISAEFRNALVLLCSVFSNPVSDTFSVLHVPPTAVLFLVISAAVQARVPLVTTLMVPVSSRRPSPLSRSSVSSSVPPRSRLTISRSSAIPHRCLRRRCGCCCRRFHGAGFAAVLSGTPARLLTARPAPLNAGSSQISHNRLALAHIWLSNGPNCSPQILRSSAERLDRLDNQTITTLAPSNQETIVLWTGRPVYVLGLLQTGTVAVSPIVDVQRRPAQLKKTYHY